MKVLKGCLLPLAVIVWLGLLPSVARAQYMYLDANGDGVHSSADTLNVPGLTTVDIWLRTDLNRNGTPATCSGGSYDLFAYDVILEATSGTLAWGTYSNSLASFSLLDQSSDSTVFHTSYTGSTTLAAGTYKLGTITVLIKSGRPTLDLVPQTDRGPYITGFGTHCTGTVNPSSSVLGQDWADVDGLAASSQTVYFTEDWEYSSGVLPAYWTTRDDNPSSFLVPWGVTNSGCGYVEGIYAATAAQFYCNSYANDQTAVLERSQLDMSGFTQFNVAFDERHELAANDNLTYYSSVYDQFTGSWNDQSPQTLTGSVAGWTRRTAQTVLNESHQANLFKPKFVFTSDVATTATGFYLDNIQVYGTTRPDLYAVSVTTDGALIGDQTWYLKYTLKNGGDTSSGPFLVQPYVDNIAFPVISESGLAPGATRTTISPMAPVPAGPNQFRIRIDSGGAIDEGAGGEANNDTPNQTATWVAPDLIVQSIAISPTAPRMGQPVVATVTIKNVGQLAVTTPFGVAWYRNLPSPPIQATPYDSIKTIASLAANASTILTFGGVSAQAVTWHSYAYVDRNNAVPNEANEQNNVGAAQVTWVPRNVLVTGHFFYDDSLLGSNVTYPCTDVVLYDQDATGADSLTTGAVWPDGHFVLGPVVNEDADDDHGFLDLFARVMVRSDEACWNDPADLKWPHNYFVTVAAANDSVWRFDSPSHPDWADSTLDVGTIKPTTMDGNAAMHIMRVITDYGWSRFRDRKPPGAAVPGVLVHWSGSKVPTTDTKYLASHEIYVNGMEDSLRFRPDQWDDDVIVHEYGHHIATVDTFLLQAPLQYHTQEGPSQSDTTALFEGWADFYAASKGLNQFQTGSGTYSDYGRGPGGTLTRVWWRLEDDSVFVYMHGLATPDTSRSLLNRGSTWEGSVAGALWDIYDSQNDRESPTALGDSLSDGFDFGIWAALHKQPGRRFRTIRELAGALDSVSVPYDSWRAILLHRILLDHGITPLQASLVLTGVDVTQLPGPLIQLVGSRPNPFNPTTRIAYVLRGKPTASISLRIFDVNGRLLRTMRPKQVALGINEMLWDGLNDSRASVASGVYFCELQCGAIRDRIRLVLVR